MAKCLVTGGAGFIGSHVADLLIEQGHEVIVVDNLSTGKKENVNKNAEFIEFDIRDLKSLPTDIDYVFHLAALARIQPSIEDPISANDVNLNGSLQVLELCRNKKAKLIFSSSSSIYSGDELPIHEDDDKDPKSPYALQKYICEQYIELYADLYGLEYSTLRYFNVYGERQITEGAYAALIGIFYEQKANSQKLTITNDGEQRRDFTYVGDVAAANVAAMQWPSGSYNIGTGENYSVNEIADLIGGQTENIGERIGEARETLADNNKALKQGWEPTTKVEDWINETKP